jgi:hypothetical protein
VRLVLAAAVTELLELQTAGGRLFVLRRRVIPLLAHLALQCNNFPHSKPFQFSVLSSQFSVVSHLAFHSAFAPVPAKPETEN